LLGLPTHLGRSREPMKDFSHASFSPDVISIMQQALEQAVATLPQPLRSTSQSRKTFFGAPKKVSGLQRL
jgi:hypothetical protein